MSHTDQLKRLYNQFFNIADEIKSLVEKEEFQEALSKIQYKDTLIKKFVTEKKSIVLSEEDKKEVQELDKLLIEKEESNLQMLKELHAKVGAELNKTNKNLKLNNAYAALNKPKGSILDFSE